MTLPKCMLCEHLIDDSDDSKMSEVLAAIQKYKAE